MMDTTASGTPPATSSPMLTMASPAALGSSAASSASAASPMLALAAAAGGLGKDSRWLTLEVCREFQRGRCTRSELECKFAHPPPHIDSTSGRVTCCFDSIKGKCSRKEPPCKYLHPPQHLKEQLLQNGRNNLILKAHAQQIFGGSPQVLQAPASTAHHAVGMMPTLTYDAAGRPAYTTTMGGMLPMQPYFMAHPYYGAPTATAGAVPSPYANPYAFSHSGLMSTMADGGAFTSQMAMNALVQQQKAARADRLEVQNMAASEVLTSQQAAKKRPRDIADDLVVPTVAVPVSMGIPYLKRQAIDSKGGIPIYQPAAAAAMAAYQPYAAAMQQQPAGAYLPFSSFAAPLTANTNLLGPAAAAAMAAASNGFGTNTDSVTYFDDNNQFLDTLPVCRDFRTGQCSRPQCKYVHLAEDHVEVIDGKVTVCRDFVKNKCSRSNCKYYHLPWSVIVRSPMMASVMSSAMSNTGAGSGLSTFAGGLASSSVLQQ